MPLTYNDRLHRVVIILLLCSAAFSCASPSVAEVDRWLSDLNDEHWQVRASAAAALGRAGIERSIPAVRSALADGSGEVREAAAMALGRLHARSALADIRSRIREDKDPQVVIHALFALAAIVGENDPERQHDIDMLIDKVFDERKGVDSAAKRVLLKIVGKSRLVAEVREGLRSESVEARVRASRMAIALDLPQLSGWERGIVNDKSAEVRANAYEGVRGTTGPDVLPVLLAGLHDVSPAVRVAAAKGLAELADPPALPALEKAAGEDPDAEVRVQSAAAIASMTRIPGSALPALWHFERVADRLTLDDDGACTLTRTLTVAVDGSPEPLRVLKLLLPPAFPRVDRVEDAQGSPLRFELGWHEGLRELVLPVPPIERGVPTTFTIASRSRRPVSARGDAEALVSYAPGPFSARVSELHVSFVGADDGEVASLDRAALAPRDADDLVLHVRVHASGSSLRDAAARSYTRAGDLTTIALVVVSILGALLATTLRLRRELGERADRAILVATLIAGAFLFLTPILVEDNLPYYAWARSAVFDGDLDRGDEYSEFNQTQAFAPDNREVQDPIFAPLFETPFIAAAHGLTRIVNAVSPEHAPNGFSFPYLFLTALGDFFAVLLGCLACFSLVARRVGERYALFGVLSVVAATNLLLFTYAWTGSSFQPSFLLFAVFLNHWDLTREARGRADWFAAGVLLGLLAMTRTLNAGFVVIPLLDWLFGAAVRFRKEGLPGLGKDIGSGALFVSGMLLSYAPQLLVQRLVDQTFVVDAYGVGAGRFAGFRENIGAMFFAVPDGLFAAMPVLALAFIGLVPLVRWERRLGVVLTVALALQLCAIGSYELYWGRFVYGTPYLVPCTAIFCLGLASLMRAVHSRWRRVGPALLWGVAILFAARNGWCVLRILARSMVGPSYVDMRLTELVHAMLLPDRKLDVDILRRSSEFGCLLREVVGGLRAWDPGRLLAAIGWASLLIVPVLLAYPAVAWARSWAAGVSRRARFRLAVAAMAVVWVAMMGWTAVLASRTDLDYAEQIERREVWARGFAVGRLEPGESFSLWFAPANPSERFSVITFLEGAADVPQGEPVATVELAADESRSRFELRAGVDTADFEVDRPESRDARAHAAPLDRACFSWRVGDDSSRFYTARAYRSVFEPTVATRPTAMKVTSLMTHGAIEVMVATARERKLPPDRSRRRFIPEAR